MFPPAVSRLTAYGYVIEFCARRLLRPMRSAGTWLIAGLLCGVGLPAAAAQETRNVLVLYSSARLLPAVIEGDRGLREALRSSADRRIEFYAEYLDVPQFQGESYARALAAFLREKYASQPPHVIVVAHDEALEFLLESRALLFPHAPVVHVAVTAPWLRSLSPLPANVVGIPVEYDSVRTIDLAFRLHPNATHLVLVTGSGALDRQWEARLRSEVPRFPARAKPEFLAGLPTAALHKRLAELGEDAVVFTPGYFEDGDGQVFVPAEAAQILAEAAKAPVYGPYNAFIGRGVVGGYMPSFQAMGRRAGEIVNALLDGAPPGSLRLPEVMPNALNVDWRQIGRWGIDEKAIPGDAIVHFREPSFLEARRTEVLIAVAVFLLQAGLIAGLLFERRRRHQAELADQTHRFELAHASRLAVAGELTGAIAHEINQPLGAILSNADAAELLLEAGSDRRDELRQILADIRRDDLRASEVIRRLRGLLARQQVDAQRFEINEAVSEVESLLRIEARRRGVMLDVRPASGAVPVFGDRIQIQQVLINLVLNAMDAVAEAPEDRRTVVVSVKRAAGSVVIEVRDRGHGIRPEHLPRLFDSFFSTKGKGMGLGLSIARTLVEAHGGRIRAEHDPRGGAVFYVELPASGEQAIPSPGPR